IAKSARGGSIPPLATRFREPRSGSQNQLEVVQFRPWPPDFASRGADRKISSRWFNSALGHPISRAAERIAKSARGDLGRTIPPPLSRPARTGERQVEQAVP